jgi:hypothetical protein
MRFLDANWYSFRSKNAPGNTRAGSPERNPANASRAASFPENGDLFSGDFG